MEALTRNWRATGHKQRKMESAILEAVRWRVLWAITPTTGCRIGFYWSFEPVSVEEAIKRGGSGYSRVGDSETFKAAARRTAGSHEFFAFIYTALLY